MLKIFMLMIFFSSDSRIDPLFSPVILLCYVMLSTSTSVSKIFFVRQIVPI